MLYLYARITNWLHEQEGQDLIEYALLTGLIAVVLVVILATIGTQIATIFSRVSSFLGTVPE